MDTAFKISVLATALTLSMAAMADETAPITPLVGDSAASALSASASRFDSSSSSMQWSASGVLSAEATASSNTSQTTSDHVPTSPPNSPNTSRMETCSVDGTTGHARHNTPPTLG